MTKIGSGNMVSRSFTILCFPLALIAQMSSILLVKKAVHPRPAQLYSCWGSDSGRSVSGVKYFPLYSTRILFCGGCLLGYVHTVPDRFLLRCKSCSGTVWTRINVLLQCRNCSEALSVIQFATLPFDLKRSFTKMRFRCNFCSDRSVQTWLGPFQKPIRYRTLHF